MREFCVIKLHSLTPIHIGTGRDSYDTSSNTIHSDMLMGPWHLFGCNRTEQMVLKDFWNHSRSAHAFLFRRQILFTQAYGAD